MRVFFIGMHNKPGTTPLCSSTRSGKQIDKIISRIKIDIGDEVIKTNLYDLDRWPNEWERKQMEFDWINRFNPGNNDIMVLLGSEVQNNFKIPVIGTIIKVHHPAKRKTIAETEKYVSKVAELINLSIIHKSKKQL